MQLIMVIALLGILPIPQSSGKAADNPILAKDFGRTSSPDVDFCASDYAGQIYIKTIRPSIAFRVLPKPSDILLHGESLSLLGRSPVWHQVRANICGNLSTSDRHHERFEPRIIIYSDKKTESKTIQLEYPSYKDDSMPVKARSGSHDFLVRREDLRMLLDFSS